MKTDTCESLVGEGCPTLDITKPARNRNNYCGRLAASCSFEPERVRNMQEDWHTIGTANRKSVPEPFPCIHFVGFRDDRYLNAVRVWGKPHFIHRWWDKRARREIAAGDTLIFADGEWTQEPSRYNAPDITESENAP